MHRAEKLAINTVLFAVSNFGSKALTFLLLPLYTTVLSTDQYGTIDVILTANSMMIPAISLSISEAVLRFAMEKESNKSDIYTTGIVVIGIGCIISIGLILVIGTYLDVSEYWIYMVFILASDVLYLLSSQFCRGISKNVQFAVGGIIQTAVFMFLNLVFLLGLKWRVRGYLLSLTISYVAAFMFLFFSARLYCFLNGRIHKALLAKMLRYSMPLIPNSVLWWVMNASDKFLIAHLMGKNYNGIYAVANKLPGMISMISTIFFQAWQLTAIEESDASDRNNYYSTAYEYLSSTVFLGMSLILLLLRPLFAVWVSQSYYSAWQYAPLLLFSAMFMCFVSFWGTNLVALKQTISIMKSVMFGGVTNVILNILLIPCWGLYGAAFATAIGFMITWLVRCLEGRKYFTIKIKMSILGINIMLLVLQAVALYCENYIYYEIILFIVNLYVNRRAFSILMPILRRFVKKGM